VALGILFTGSWIGVGHGSRVVYGMNCLSSLGCRDRSNPTRGMDVYVYVYVYSKFVLSCVVGGLAMS
jgi:hypothetical protein